MNLKLVMSSFFAIRKPRRVRLQGQSRSNSGEVLETRQVLSAVTTAALAGNSRVAAVNSHQSVTTTPIQGNSRIAALGTSGQTNSGGALSNVALNRNSGTTTAVTSASAGAATSSASAFSAFLTNDSEPNNSPAQANNIGVFGTGRHSKTIYGHIGLSGDSQDWYKITLNGNTSASFNLGSMTQDLDLELYSSSGTRVAYSNRSGTQNDVISRTLLSGTYYVRVVQYQRNASGYALRITLDVQSPSGRLPDASLRTNGSGIASGRLQTGQEQWFQFTITTRRSVTFTLSGLSSDLDLEVYSGPTTSSRRLGFSGNSGTANDSIRLNSLAAGTYWVRVLPFRTAASAYRLTFNLTGRV